jgi:heme/copper-type cytochrome/quinol oxidase subunit 2
MSDDFTRKGDDMTTIELVMLVCMLLITASSLAFTIYGVWKFRRDERRVNTLNEFFGDVLNDKSRLN